MPTAEHLDEYSCYFKCSKPTQTLRSVPEAGLTNVHNQEILELPSRSC